MPNNLNDIGTATRQAVTDTTPGQEHITIQEYKDNGHEVLGWERMGYATFVIFLA